MLSEELVQKGFDSLRRRDVARARATLAELALHIGAGAPLCLYLEGHIALAEERHAAGKELFERAVHGDPDDPDLRYALALSCEQAGDLEGMMRQFLQVRMLDAQLDRLAAIGDPEVLASSMSIIEQVAEQVLAELPEPFNSKLAHVPVVLEPRPSVALVRDGFDPRAFGLFEGASQLDAEIEAPTRIVLYTANLMAEFTDASELEEQVEITILHEVGHFFGLEEEDMERLGLE